MNHRRLAFLFALLASHAFAGIGCFAADALPTEATAEITEAVSNAFCPVMPEMESSPEITLRYKGHQVRFCCTGCRREFLANPEKYLARLPHISPPGTTEKTWEFIGKHTDLMMIGSLAVGLIWLRISRTRWSSEQAGRTRRSWVTRLYTKTVSPTTPLLLLLMFAGYEINALDSALFFQVHPDLA